MSANEEAVAKLNIDDQLRTLKERGMDFEMRRGVGPNEQIALTLKEDVWHFNSYFSLFNFLAGCITTNDFINPKPKRVVANKFFVSVGPGQHISFLRPIPPRITFEDAVLLSAWLLVFADSDNKELPIVRELIEQL